jgi:hypothetical protein
MGLPMSLLPLDLVWARAERTRIDGEIPFEELLYVGEAIFKTYVVSLVAGLDDDPERHRYKLAHKLVRGQRLGRLGRCTRGDFDRNCRSTFKAILR